MHVGQTRTVVRERLGRQGTPCWEWACQARRRRARRRPRHDARVVVGARAVHQHAAAGLSSRCQSSSSSVSSQIHHEVRLRTRAAVADGGIVHLGERPDGRAAAFGSERGERQREPSFGKRGRCTQQRAAVNAPLPAASMPYHFSHVFLLSASTAAPCAPPSPRACLLPAECQARGTLQPPARKRMGPYVRRRPASIARPPSRCGARCPLSLWVV